VKFHSDNGARFIGGNQSSANTLQVWLDPQEFEATMKDQKDRSTIEKFFREFKSVKKLSPQQVADILKVLNP
jgi:hypothetical protein